MSGFSSIQFEPDSPYRRLARALDALPNRFPPAANESDLRILAGLFSPEEADLAAGLSSEPEALAAIAGRLGRDLRETQAKLKEMVRKGLILIGKTDQGRPGFGLLPFVVGIYENQGSHIDAELAGLFEDYFLSAFGRALDIRPQVHRVIPVGVSIKNSLEVQPFESASGLIERAQSWGVLDCICRKQKALIGKPCGHPVDVCMILSDRPDAFHDDGSLHVLSLDGALQTLHRAAEAGLVHCISNNQRDISYICNCCTCSCGVLRAMADLGMADVVARSAFVNHVDENLCIACGECMPACQFNALELDGGSVRVVAMRCAGCGVCVLACPEGALGLERRLGEAAPPVSEADWRAARVNAG